MRHAFTLIELLVVIAILALLAAILFPALGSATRNAQAAKDGKQMGQLAQAVLQWRINIGRAGSHLFPGKIMDLADTNKGGPLDGEMSIFVSPADPSGGHDEDLNASAVADTWSPSDIHEPGCSYLYECSSEDSPWTSVAGAPDSLTIETWADYKRAQKKFGNIDENGDPAPFSEDVIPIMRNFWHYEWNSASQADMRSKSRVLNATWSTRVYWSIPFWEKQANPDIPWP